MQMSDVIADMLTRIRNASDAKHATVDIPASNMKKSIADILVAEGYVKGYQVIMQRSARLRREPERFSASCSEQDFRLDREAFSQIGLNEVLECRGGEPCAGSVFDILLEHFRTEGDAHEFGLFLFQLFLLADKADFIVGQLFQFFPHLFRRERVVNNYR